MFKKDLKCLVLFHFHSSGRVNKGRCWQSSVSAGKGQRAKDILSSQVDWAGLEAVQCQTNLPSIDLQLSQHLDTEVTFKLYFYHKTSGTPYVRLPPDSAHLALAAFSPGPRSSWSFSHGFILTLTIAKHHTSSTEPARATITFIRNNVCVYGHVRVFNEHSLLNP